MRLFMRRIFVCFLFLFLLGCGKGNPNQDEAESTKRVESETQVEKFTDIDFSEKEIDYINQLKEKGVVRIAIREVLGIYVPQVDGRIRGFNYHLFKKFTEEIDIAIDVKLVKFSDYFSLNGTTPKEIYENSDFFYKPDLLSEVDVYIDSLTVLPWREQILSFIPIIPTKIVLVTRKDDKITAIEQLNNKKVSVVYETSYYKKFKDIEKERNIEFEYILVESTAQTFEYVNDSKADFTARDVNRAIVSVQAYNNLDVSLPISEQQILGWAVAKENSILANILKKYIQFSKSSGLLDKLWLDDYEITLEEYYDLLEY